MALVLGACVSTVDDVQERAGSPGRKQIEPRGHEITAWKFDWLVYRQAESGSLEFAGIIDAGSRRPIAKDLWIAPGTDFGPAEASELECRGVTNLFLPFEEAVRPEPSINSAALIRGLKSLKLELPFPEDPQTTYDLSGLARFRDLRRLDLSGSFGLGDLSVLRSLSSVGELSLQGTHLVASAISHVRTMRNLERLNVSGTTTDDSALVALSDLSRLEWLDLGSTEVNGSGLAAIASANVPLAFLGLRDTALDEVGLEALGKFPALRTLDLSHARNPLDLRSLSALGELRDLNLACAKEFADDDLAVFSSRMSGNLRSLDLTAANLTDSGVQAISRHAGRLRSLVLKACRRLSPASFGCLVKLQRLESLDLSGTAVSGRELVDIAGSLWRLRRLSLRNCALVRSVDALELSKLESLEALDLSYTAVDDAVLTVLSGMPRLKRIALLGCHSVTDRGIAVLESRSVEVIRD